MKIILLMVLVVVAASVFGQLTDNQRNGAFSYASMGGFRESGVQEVSRIGWRNQFVAPPSTVRISGRADAPYKNSVIVITDQYVGSSWSYVNVAVTNYPDSDKVLSDKNFSCYASRKGGVMSYRGSQIEVFEYFDADKYCAKVVEDRQKAAKQIAEEKHKADDISAAAGKAKALKLNQEAADKGDVYGLLRMGERYRDGEGVPKDEAKAKEYLTKASAAGSETAKLALEKMEPVK